MAILFLHEIHLVQLWEGFGPPGRTIGWRFHFANGSGFFLLKSLNEGIFFRSGLSYSDHSMRVFVSEQVELHRSLNAGIFFRSGLSYQDHSMRVFFRSGLSYSMRVFFRSGLSY